MQIMALFEQHFGCNVLICSLIGLTLNFIKLLLGMPFLFDLESFKDLKVYQALSIVECVVSGQLLLSVDS